eukprot:m.307146 g.307146  ORF g.307146 m.307146 type:complete len:115 (+) comp55312_c0_seq4:1246-1590(+)
MHWLVLRSPQHSHAALRRARADENQPVVQTESDVNGRGSLEALDRSLYSPCRRADDLEESMNICERQQEWASGVLTATQLFCSPANNHLSSCENATPNQPRPATGMLVCMIAIA